MPRSPRPKPTKPAVDLAELSERFQSEDACHAYLAGLRWPEGTRCLRCGGTSLSRIAKGHRYECNAPSCRYQFSVRVGTIFGDTHLPLWKWFMATFLICEAKKGMSAAQLSRTLGMTSKTAWYLCHRIRAAMAEVQPRPLTGVVETDETYLGGKPRRKAGHPQHGESFDTERRRETSRAWHRNKTIVLGAVERGGEVRLQMVPHARKGNVMDFLTSVVDDHAAAIYSDEFRSYDQVGDADTVHAAVNHRAGEWVRGDVHTNTIESVWSLLDRAILGSYHQLSVKHLPAYLEEFEWRFNNRTNPFLFRDTLLRLLDTEPLRYRDLIADRAVASS